MQFWGKVKLFVTFYIAVFRQFYTYIKPAKLNILTNGEKIQFGSFFFILEKSSPMGLYGGMSDSGGMSVFKWS